MKLVITDIADLKLSINGEYKLVQPQGNIHPCIGCFGCWVKTPGVCVIHDGYENTGIYMSQCDELIIISECCYGGYSPFVKNVVDRGLSYIHPDFVIRKGEMHHKRRYKNVISLSAYFYGDHITDAEKETAKNILQANADNYDGLVKEVKFYPSVKEVEAETL